MIVSVQKNDFIASALRTEDLICFKLTAAVNNQLSACSLLQFGICQLLGVQIGQFFYFSIVYTMFPPYL